MRGLMIVMIALASTATGWAQMNWPQTLAERTKYQETTSTAGVREFLAELVQRAPHASLLTIGHSHEGRPLETICLASKPCKTIEEIRATQRPVLFAFANIHAGEVDGKEALLMLARELAQNANHPLLEKAVVVLLPNLNPDSNDKLGPKNRPEQNGPPLTGLRHNAQNLDLNRDFTKLETPEIRALVKFVRQIDPLVTIDCHTTNGSYHRYKLTYDGPRHPLAGEEFIHFSRKVFLPAVTQRIRQQTNYETFTYGNFADNHARWESYPALPRFGVQYFALTGRFALLSESYSHASFEERVKATLSFVKSSFELSLEHQGELRRCLEQAAKARAELPLRTSAVAEQQPETILGFVEENRSGRSVPTTQPREYPVQMMTRVRSEITTKLPAAYLIPAEASEVIQTLQRHGIQLQELRESLELETVGELIKSIKTNQPSQRVRPVYALESEARTQREMIPAGTVLLKTAQPLGHLGGYLLEAACEDGLLYWGQLAKLNLRAGQLYPIRKLNAVPEGLLLGEVAPLPEDKPAKKPITAAVLGRGGFGGGFAAPIDWLPDGEHYLQARGGKLLQVEARTGKTSPFFEPEKLTASLKAIPQLNQTSIEQIIRSPVFRMTPDRQAALINVGSNVALAYFDGTPARMLTKQGTGEFLTLSPTGQAVAFVRGGNLFTATLDREIQLTTDANADILNGKADWVYEEEIFNRNGRAYWWSPNGQQLAFLRFDDKPVHRYHLMAATPARGRLESYAYPKTGDPNPLVSIGVVSVSGGPITFLNLSAYKPEEIIISRVGWLGSSTVPFAFVQNREQTWLDFLTWPDLAGPPVKLFRETTKAWVEDLGEPRVLSDKSLLILSERTGWKHLYHYAADGRLLKPITSGEWEIQAVLRVDEAAGWVYFTATKDNVTGSHLYRVKLTGEGLERLTPAGGTHTVSLAPKGPLFVDRYTDDETPTISSVREVGTNFTRTLDSNPNRLKEEYIFGRYERVQVPMTDGFLLEGAITYPPSFDPKKTYPVWVMTYAGPHAPTVRTGWGNGRLMEQVLAGMGIVVFRVDPRSASGKGAISAWSCYKQMGVQELKDLEQAVEWLAKNPWVDRKRVGLSGHSYGGYMTAYALTHSKVFSAGIAGAPVTDWRLYDTIYTERYMGLPKDNPSGYAKSSVVQAANQLHGKLLIIHGMMDDNVHLQNTAQLVDALQRANKEFDMMIYPNARHGIGGAHYQKLQLNFIAKTMGVTP